MKRLSIIVFLSLGLLSALAQPQDPAAGRFVGAQTCAACHDADKGGMNPFQIWRASRHSASFQDLESCTERSARDLGSAKLWIVRMGNGEAYGLPTPARESKYCLPCHVTGFGADSKLLDATFDPKSGVQCESCHGPGSAHVVAMRSAGDGGSASPMKRYKDENAIRAKCLTCHDGTCGPFDFAEAWPRIKHAAR